MMSLRRTVHVPAGDTVPLFATIVASTRAEVLDLADKYRDARTFERTERSRGPTRKCNCAIWHQPEEAHLFQRLANAVFYSDATLRPTSDVLSSTA